MTARLGQLAAHARRLAFKLAGPGGPKVRTDSAGKPLGPWYSIRNADDGTDRAVVLLDGEIGWDVESSSFTRDLNAITASAIDLHINSPGGSAWDGYAIYNALVNHPATVTAHIVGVAASAASFIAMAGDEIVAYRPSELMIHDASGWVDVWGSMNPADLNRVMVELQGLKAALDLTSDEIAAVYARKAGGTADEWRTRMQATTWYTPDTALAAGLVDRIAGDEPAEDSPAPGETGASNSGGSIRVADLVRARHARLIAPKGSE